MLKFVGFSKTGVVLLILQQNCEKMQLRLSLGGIFGTVAFKPRADTSVTFLSHVHRTVAFPFVISSGT